MKTGKIVKALGAAEAAGFIAKILPLAEGMEHPEGFVFTCLRNRVIDLQKRERRLIAKAAAAEKARIAAEKLAAREAAWLKGLEQLPEIKLLLIGRGRLVKGGSRRPFSTRQLVSISRSLTILEGLLRGTPYSVYEAAFKVTLNVLQARVSRIRKALLLLAQENGYLEAVEVLTGRTIPSKGMRLRNT